MARTYTVVENEGTRKFQEQTPGDGSTVFTYEFTIRPTSGTKGTNDEEYEAAYDSLRTYLGVPIGKLTDISQFSESPFGELGSVRSVNFEHVPSSDHVYLSVVTWQSEFPVIYETLNAGTHQSLVTSGQSSIRFSTTPALRMVDLYKNAALPPMDDQEDNTTFYDQDYLVTTGQTYNGQAVIDLDINTQPQKWPVRQMEVVIEEPWVKAVSLGTDKVGAWPSWDGNADHYLHRNLEAFMGFPAGTLLYMGTTATPRSFHTYTLSHRFLYDEFQHFFQQTFQGVLGIENLSFDDDVGGTGLGAQLNKDVFWCQHYAVNTFSDFGFANAATEDQLARFEDWDDESGPIKV